MLKLKITGATTTQAIESAIPFLDMKEHAIEQRDAAKSAALDDETVLELHEIRHVTVLYSPTFGYAYCNTGGAGTGSSELIGNGEAESPEHAVQIWFGED